MFRVEKTSNCAEQGVTRTVIKPLGPVPKTLELSFNVKILQKYRATLRPHKPTQTHTLLLELSLQDGSIVDAVIECDKAIQAFSFNGMRCSYHGCLSYCLVLHQSRFHLCCAQQMT